MKRIIIDMDDVLADTTQKIIDRFNLINNESICKEQFEDSDFYTYVRQEKYLSYRDVLYEPGFFLNLEVFPDAQEIVKKLTEKYEVFIVSAATEFPNSLSEKQEWLNKYFPFISWERMVFCGDKTVIKGDIMIDDHERNFAGFEGFKLLYHSPHNTLVRGFKRVKNWKEIYEILQ